MLIEQMKKDRIGAMKDIDPIRKNLLSTLIGDASKQDKNPSDEKVIATIKSFLKNIQKSIDECNEKGIKIPEEMDFQYHIETLILEGYLPKQLTETEIRKIITCDIIHVTRLAENPLKLGDVMSHFSKNYKGLYDGSLVSTIAKEMLQK